MMWADFCKRWFELCCWWLPTTKTEQRSGLDAKPSKTVAEDVSTDLRMNGGEVSVDPDEDDSFDDLTVIKGIGPSTQAKLRSFGITSMAALAASDPEELAANIKASQPISMARIKRWIEAAQEQATDRT
jgi:predicted flap endonuclease-1-like 5' DNA nuclease